MGSKLFTKDDIPTKLFLNNKVSYQTSWKPCSSLISRQWVSGSGNDITLKNPKNEEEFTSFKGASAEDVDKAVDNATVAFETGAWSQFPGNKRGQCLAKLADLIEEHADELAHLESIASGRPLIATNRDVPMCAAVFRCKYHR